jgi:predicted metal-dependent phosphoesterase TrpH
MLADFHTHTRASDGELAPAELVQRAASQGLSVLAITDHDTLAGLTDARRAARDLGVTFVDGVEISTDVPFGELHILGYGIAVDNRELNDALEHFRAASVRRLKMMLELLRQLSIDLDASIVVPLTQQHAVGRPHIARALVAAGHAVSVADAFERYLGEGRPAYVRKDRELPATAVQLVREARGVPVLAHPLGVRDLDSRLDALIQAGLKGLECFYAEYSPAERDSLTELADSRGLLATGGSDFHGDHSFERRALGSVEIPPRRIFALLEALSQAGT